MVRQHSLNNVDVVADNRAACECADEAGGGRAATDAPDPGREPRQQCERGRQVLLAALAATLPAGTGNLFTSYIICYNTLDQLF